MKQIYKKSLWRCFIVLFLFVILSGVEVFLFFVKKGTERYLFLIGTPATIIFGIGVFQVWRSFTITVEDKFISKEEGKIGRWKVIKPEYIQLKWEDIIAMYVVETELPRPRQKSILIFPKADTGDKERDEAINLEVKINKKSKCTKAYADWLIVKKKGIKIPKSIKGYRDLLKEIHKRAPQAVIDDEIRKLMEK